MEAASVPQKKSIPSYRLHRGSGQAVVTLNGRDVYLGVHGTPESKDKYQDMVRKLRADQAKAEMAHTVRFHVDITVAELAAKYVKHAETYYVKNGKPTTQVLTIKSTVNILLAKHSHLEAVKFGPIALQSCRDQFVEQKLARTEVNRRVGLVRGLFKWGVSQELIPATVLVGLQSLPGLRRGRTTAPDRKKVRPVPQALVEAALPHLSPQIAAMVQLQELTGMRPAEVVQMRGCDLTMGGPSWEYRPEHHKLEHLEVDRVIMIGPRAQAVLKPWLRAETQAYLFSPKESLEATWAEAGACWEERRKSKATGTKSDTAKSIWDEVRDRRSGKASTESKKRRERRRAPGNRYSVPSYRRAIHRACDLAGIDRWSPNRLRHNAATKIRRELDIEHARAVLGHSDADTTAIYAERDMQLARQAAERIG
jgi:integrase